MWMVRAGVLAIGLCLAGCGGGSASSPAPGASVTAATPVAALALVFGGSYVTVVNPGLVFDVQLFTIAASGSVIPDGTALANPV